MNEIYEFLKKARTYFLATTENDQPKVRPFGTINIFENKLYIQTGRKKNVARQIFSNPKIAISAMDWPNWLRIEAVVIPDERIEAKKSMLDAYPELHDRYDENDENTLMLYLKDVYATIENFGGEKKEFRF